MSTPLTTSIRNCVRSPDVPQKLGFLSVDT